MKQRLYIDEVGNPDLAASDDPNHRYLSLTGVSMDLKYVADTVFPRIEQLKSKHFGSHPDEPVILHRNHIINAKPPFDALKSPVTRAAFDAELLALVRELEYAVFTVTIDKKEHLERYPVWQYHPYHYCLKVMIERYVQWLDRMDATGDVMAESRGGKEDTKLKDSFRGVYAKGTEYVAAALIQARLTSGQLKVKPKVANVAGLQLADMVAHPSFKAALARRKHEKLPSNFGGQMADILEKCKYYRKPGTTIGPGQTEGWGRKWLP